MDNKAYLDEIAVKGKRKGADGPLLSPAIIKLIIVAVFAVIALAVVGGIISSKNTANTQLYEKVYSRVAAFADKKGPFAKYQNYINSSSLRALNISVRSSLETTRSTLASAASGVKIDIKNITPEVKKSESSNTSLFTSHLDDARLLGELDATFASEAAYQLTMLISLEQEALAKVTDVNFANALSASVDDLTLLRDSYSDWSPNGE